MENGKLKMERNDSATPQTRLACPTMGAKTFHFQKRFRADTTGASEKHHWYRLRIRKLIGSCVFALETIAFRLFSTPMCGLREVPKNEDFSRKLFIRRSWLINRPAEPSTPRKRSGTAPGSWRCHTGAGPCSAGWPCRRRRTGPQTRSGCTSDSCGC